VFLQQEQEDCDLPNRRKQLESSAPDGALTTVYGHLKPIILTIDHGLVVDNNLIYFGRQLGKYANILSARVLEAKFNMQLDA